MRRSFVIDIRSKPEGYLEALEAWLQSDRPVLYCELSRPKKRMFMGLETWFRRYTSTDINRICARIVDPVIHKDRMTFEGELTSHGSLGDQFDRLQQYNLSTRMLIETGSRRVDTIYAFDITY